ALNPKSTTCTNRITATVTSITNTKGQEILSSTPLPTPSFMPYASVSPFPVASPYQSPTNENQNQSLWQQILDNLTARGINLSIAATAGIGIAVILLLLIALMGRKKNTSSAQVTETPDADTPTQAISSIYEKNLQAKINSLQTEHDKHSAVP